MKTLKNFKQFVNENIKTLKKMSKKFKEEYYSGSEKIFIRDFATVIIDEDEKQIPLMCVAQIYDLRESGAIGEDEIPEEGDVQLELTLYPYLEYVDNKFKEDGEDISDVYSYIGGIPLDANDKTFFKTMEEAEAYVMSKELNDKIDTNAVVVGFIMDKSVNKVGSTGWDVLYHLIDSSKPYMPIKGHTKK